MNPICCGKRAKPYRKMWVHNRVAYIVGAAHGNFWVSFSFVEGFRCKLCGTMIPIGEPTDRYELDCEAVRLDGIAFDKSLEEQLTTKP